MYFSWRNRPVLAGTRDLWPYYTGLLRTDATAKPALAAFTAAACCAGRPARSEPVAVPQDPSPACNRRAPAGHPWTTGRA